MTWACLISAMALAASIKVLGWYLLKDIIITPERGNKFWKNWDGL